MYGCELLYSSLSVRPQLGVLVLYLEHMHNPELVCDSWYLTPRLEAFSEIFSRWC